MIDTRFHLCTGPARLADLLEAAGCLERAPGDLVIEGAGDLVDAGPHTLSFAQSKNYAKDLERTRAGAVLVTEALARHVPEGTIAVISQAPYDAFIAILDVLYPNDTHAVVAGAVADGPAPLIEPGVIVGAHVSIGPGAQIGSGTVIGPNSAIGAGVAIGRNCVVGANVSIQCAYLGNDVVVQPGAVIGAEGFGFRLRADRHKKIPQLGRVIIQDRAEIGANTTVDRGTLSDTVIGEGTKIDNLVQIGHNCRLGRNCILGASCALAGSTVLEDGVVMAGGSVTSGHLTIGANTVIFGRSGITHSFPPGSNIAGAPAQDVRKWRREIAAVRRLSKGDRV